MLYRTGHQIIYPRKLRKMCININWKSARIKIANILLSIGILLMVMSTLLLYNFPKVEQNIIQDKVVEVQTSLLPNYHIRMIWIGVSLTILGSLLKFGIKETFKWNWKRIRITTALFLLLIFEVYLVAVLVNLYINRGLLSWKLSFSIPVLFMIAFLYIYLYFKRREIEEEADKELFK